MRLFIAADIPEPMRAWIADRRQEIQRQWPDVGLRWTPPEQWHVTLQFLGECPEQKISAIQTAMKRAVKGLAPFAITLGKPGTFSGPRLGVLWLGVESGRQELTASVGSLRESLRIAGFKEDKQPYRGHVTLARSRAKIPSQALRNFPPPPTCPEARVDRLILYQSTLDSAGARYDMIGRVQF